MTRLLLAGAAALALGACAHTAEHGDHAHHHGDHGAAEAHTPELAVAKATMLGADGLEIGWARFEQGPHGVLIRMELAPGSLTPGWHGLHLHEVGDCSDPGSYMLSGGHHGKAPGAHGLMNPEGPEEGDLPNVWAASDGSAGYEAFTTLTELVPALNGDGLSIIIHANEDDHRSQPIGGAGPRVACGVVARAEP
ncbi:superoxide dismutase family protein [Hyphomonas sp.]|uniref:superoxide dismutase family protein n=1 Tax=Hyphomonas sp. TaxID=87 RepID=UPI00391966F1